VKGWKSQSGEPKEGTPVKDYFEGEKTITKLNVCKKLTGTTQEKKPSWENFRRGQRKRTKAGA